MVLKNAVDWYNEGIDLHRSGNYEEAIQCYDRALEIDPKGADVWNNKGVAFKNLGHYDEAIKCYDRALKIDPKYARAWLNKSVALGNLGRYDEAIQCYDRALEVDPKDADAWYSKGVALNELGRYDEAVQCYDHALKIDPKYASHRVIGDLRLQHRALEIDPKYAYAWHNKGVALDDLGRYDEAISCYDRALEVDPKYAYAWNGKGNALKHLGRYDEAISCYDRALEVDPKYAYAWYNKGNALDDLGRYDEAIACYDRALEVDPKYAYAWHNKGVALKHLGRYDEAIACYDRALEVDPKHAHAWNSKGNALNDLGRYDEAIACYDRALEVDPKYASAWHNKGIALKNLGRYDEAIGCYDRALEVDPKFASAWNGKGIALDDLGRYDKAIACYDRALEVDPKYAYAWNNKGVALGNLGRYDEAIRCYDRALEIDPEYTLAKDNRDKALRKLVDTTTSGSSHPGKIGKPTQSPAHPAEPIKTRSSITIERTIYDPLTRDFIISSSRPLVNVRDWINRHDPSSYWLVICVHNHGNHTIDEWGIELESSSTLQILETVIEGSDGRVHPQISNPRPWLRKSILGIPHHLGIVIPRGGSRRVYFRLGSESCGISHSIKGRLIASDAEVGIREKQFQHSCDVATLGVAIHQSPEIALQYAENTLMQRYQRETALSYLRTFHLIQEIDTCCRTKRFDDVHDKLHVLEDTLDKMGVSERLVVLVKQLNALDIDDGMGGSMLELKAQRAERMCRNIVDVLITEVLMVPRC
ncbi:MAG: tetratricopeptide repeat protein [Candidatus Methanomethylophilaceae archaeon]|nr:tetratricopeptide repeat protein [Candidatus Methanomethylophilaceae archaeon]